MTADWLRTGIAPANILLPNKTVDLTKYAVVACDQYTSEPDYWQKTEAEVGTAPSTLQMVLPEVYLEQAQERIPSIHKAMTDYLYDGTLETKVEEGFVLTIRTTQSGERVGLVAKLDLEAYSYEKGAQSMVRATEGTILSRIPPRMKVRQGAPLELPHVLILMDDSYKTVIEPLYEKRDTFEELYDFELMQGGGHLKGYAITAQTDLNGVRLALEALKEKVAFLFAVGDGNHSLATAKATWEEVKKALSQEEQEIHPARYALVEVENIHCPALQFEPIHRLLKNVNDVNAFINALLPPSGDKHVFTVVASGETRQLSVPVDNAALPVGTLQNYLDAWLADNPTVEIDYIHGEKSVNMLAKNSGCIGFLVPTLEKGELFTAVNQDGALPRKTFSMGEAHEKRYYLEGRLILPNK